MLFWRECYEDQTKRGIQHPQCAFLFSDFADTRIYGFIF